MAVQITELNDKITELDDKIADLNADIKKMSSNTQKANWRAMVMKFINCSYAELCRCHSSQRFILCHAHCTFLISHYRLSLFIHLLWSNMQCLDSSMMEKRLVDAFTNTEGM
jgi:hypothetical protein